MINQAGEILTKSFESLRLKAYRDSAGILTIGWGHTSDKKFAVKPDSVITLSDAEDIFLNDVGEAEDTLKHELVNWQLLEENQYAALTDFVFNRGTLNWHSGRHTKIYDLLVEKNYFRAADEFFSFTKDVAGNTLKGLLRRRTAERLLFLAPVEKTSVTVLKIKNLIFDLKAEDFEMPHDLSDDKYDMNFVNVPDKPEALQ